MRHIVYATLLLTVAASAAHAQVWNDCKYSEERSATVEAGGAQLLDLDAGAGLLKIEGKAGITSVQIRGKACASDKELLQEIKLEARREGSTVRVKANVQDHDFSFGSMRNEYARLDVVIEVPLGMAARIDDGSGDMELAGLGDTEIDDGSGGIVASNLASAHINDGSGEIDLTNIRGRVDIDDGSGGIELHDIAGDITIDDGSGEIEVRDAHTNVRISDSSGSINVANVGGNFIVTDDGSGSIDYDNVKGRVELPAPRGRHRRDD